jgi:Predicted nucleoside-diphosphate-sugar epimerases
MKNTRALIIGATGATGKDLVNVLLQDCSYNEVVLFVRRPFGIVHPKLVEVFTDFDHQEKVADQIRGDILFSCLGTTLKAAGSKDNQWHIDYQVPLKFAQIAQSNGVQSLVLLSAYGAATDSKIFYSRVKGALEVAMERLAFDQYIIFKPGSLVRKDSDRVAEHIINAAFKFLNSFGILKRFRPLPTAILAAKLAKAPQTLSNGKHIVELEKIFSF